MLSKESVAKFQEIYKKKTGKEISISEARELGGKVFDLFMEIYTPLEDEKSYENTIHGTIPKVRV